MCGYQHDVGTASSNTALTGFKHTWSTAGSLAGPTSRSLSRMRSARTSSSPTRWSPSVWSLKPTATRRSRLQRARIFWHSTTSRPACSPCSSCPMKLARRHLVVPLLVDNRTLTYAPAARFSAEAETDLGFASGRRHETRDRDTCRRPQGPRPLLSEARPAGRPRQAPSLWTVPRPRLETARPARPHPPSRCAMTSSGARSPSAPATSCIERRVHGVAIRFRVGGAFQSMPTFPGAVAESIADQFKTMARVGVAVRHRPQEGTFQVPVNGRPMVVRLSTRPLPDGEEIVMQSVDGQSAFGVTPRRGTPIQAPGRLRVLVADDEVVARLMTEAHARARRLRRDRSHQRRAGDRGRGA